MSLLRISARNQFCAEFVERGYRLYSWCVVWWRSVWLFVSSVRSWSFYVCLAPLLCVVQVIWRAVWICRVYCCVQSYMNSHSAILCLIERMDYLSYFSSVVCIERGLYCVLELYLHCGAVLVWGVRIVWYTVTVVFVSMSLLIDSDWAIGTRAVLFSCWRCLSDDFVFLVYSVQCIVTRELCWADTELSICQYMSVTLARHT